MILKYKDWSFSIHLKGVNTLIIENPKLFREMLTDINNQYAGMEGGFYLYDDFKEYSVNKELELINSPLLQSVNDKKIISKLYEELKREIVESEYERFKEIENNIIGFLKELIFNSNVELDINKSIEISDVLKISGIKIQDQFFDFNLTGKLLQGLIVLDIFIHPKAIVCINIRDLFSKEEWEEFVKEVILRDINLIIIESHHNGVVISDEKIYTIDEDLCEIY